MLDVGTDRPELLEDPLYLGVRHKRPAQEPYDAFIDAYVTTALKIFPHALLHWEDFGPGNARRILDRYRGHILTFNDDMQGTGAVNLAAVLAGARASQTPLTEHRVVIFGSGTAGIGIADQLRDAMTGDGLDPAAARARLWCLDRYGLLTDDMTGLRDFQVPYARPAAEVRDWPGHGTPSGIGLAEVVGRVHPTILIGTSTQHGAFTEPIVREMAAHVDRPVILPMSNPTTLSEAIPADLLDLDRRPGPHRHRQPVRPRHLPGRHLPDRPGQQRPGLPRPRPGRASVPGPAHHRPHDHRRRPGRRRTHRHHHARRCLSSRPSTTSAPPRRGSPSRWPRPPPTTASPGSPASPPVPWTPPCGNRSTRPCARSERGAGRPEVGRRAAAAEYVYSGAAAHLSLAWEAGIHMRK